MKGKKLFYSIAALILASSIFAVGCGSGADANANANTEAQPVTVTTEAAVIKPIPTYVEATGSLAGDEETNVAPAVSGKIVEVNFDIGSYVQKGSVLMRLDPRDAAIRARSSESTTSATKRSC